MHMQGKFQENLITDIILGKKGNSKENSVENSVESIPSDHRNPSSVLGN